MQRNPEGRFIHDKGIFQLNSQTFFGYCSHAMETTFGMKRISPSPEPGRIEKVRQALLRRRLDGFLVTDIANVRYLSGFTGSSGAVLLTGNESVFITDFRYREQSAKEVPGFEIVLEKGYRISIVLKLCRKLRIEKLGFESSASFDFYRKMSAAEIELTAVDGLVEKFRMIKEAREIDLIQQAVRRAEAAFLGVRPHIRQGMTEQSVALRLEEGLKKNGCRRIPFDIIVASGTNSALPHAKPTEKKLERGDLVIIDWGGEAGGYYSDMTRTLLLRGGKTLKQEKIYRTVLESNSKAIAAVSPGKASTEIDAVARDAIKKAGYGKLFGHGTGHGVGLQVHELPRITWVRKEIIQESMVFTIEPGIYMPGTGGVRIEDMVLVRKEKAETLTSLPKNLEIL